MNSCPLNPPTGYLAVIRGGAPAGASPNVTPRSARTPAERLTVCVKPV
jgi:hypothetical protein